MILNTDGVRNRDACLHGQQSWLSALITLLTGLGTAYAVAGYDPLVLPSGTLPKPLELTVADAGRDREIPLRVYLPAKGRPAPVVLFSPVGTRRPAIPWRAGWTCRASA